MDEDRMLASCTHTAARADSSSRSTLVDDRIEPAVIEALQSMGHRIETVSEDANATGYDFAHPRPGDT